MAIGRYRKAPPDASAVIGCVLLRDLFFVPEGQALDAPSDFAKNIVSFKSYDLSAGGRHVDVMFDTMLNMPISGSPTPLATTWSYRGQSSGVTAWSPRPRGSAGVQGSGTHLLRRPPMRHHR